MDNVTHSLTGLLLARAGLNRVTPLATVALLVASNIPDGDIITALTGGALTYLEYHRHITHALIAAPVMGSITALLLFWMKGWRFLPVALVATIGVWVHIALDLFNNYGVRIWLPFQPDWVSWDILMVVDPWLTGFLALCLVGPWLSRLVGGEMGAKTTPGRTAAVLGLTFIVLWAGFRFTLHERALETLRNRQYQGMAPVRVAAWPTPWNPFTWRGYVSTENFWSIHNFNLNSDFDPEAGTVYFKPTDAALINAARRTPEAQAYLRFAQYPVWRVIPVAEPENGAILEATDVRFGNPEDGKFQLRITLDGARKPVSATFEFGSAVKGIGIIRD